MKIHLRSFSVILLSCSVVVGMMILSGCAQTGVSANLSQPTSVATVPYLPPTVVPNTPVPTAVATATATPLPRPPIPTTAPASLSPGPLPYGSVPNIGGQLILVSLSQQWLFAYQDQRLIFRSAVTTGMPELPTLTGTFHIRWHEQNVTFYSPWPVGSPYYYSPEHINYAMYYQDYGYYIHDAPWRQTFGPGTNYPHVEPNGQTVTGSHGCVNMPTGAMSWLYSWARNGATVVIYGRAPSPPPAPAATATPTTPPPPPATATPTNAPAPLPTPMP